VTFKENGQRSAAVDSSFAVSLADYDENVTF
jgi:hypothetical protein